MPACPFKPLSSVSCYGMNQKAKTNIIRSTPSILNTVFQEISNDISRDF